MVKKTYFYKFMINLDRKLKPFEVKEIKELIWKYFGDIKREQIQGGVSNNNGNYKFKRKMDYRTKNGRC